MASSKTSKKPAQTQADQKAASKQPVKAVKGDGAKKGAQKGDKPGLIAKARGYFKNVRSELKRVVWPTKADLVKYTGAVLGMLVFFGLLIAIVDAVIVPVLYAFSGLR